MPFHFAIWSEMAFALNTSEDTLYFDQAPYS